MKLVEMLAVLSLTLNVANAADTENADTDYNAYCMEQAEMSGIEDAAEKSSYIKECIESLAEPSADAPSQDR